jgi:hypothetical protein
LCFVLSFGGAGGALADPPPGTEGGASASSSSSNAPKSLPQTSFFATLKQSLKQGYDHEVVRGHFDLGSPPNVRRYYCLVDTKTGNREPNGVLGQPVPQADGMTSIKDSFVSLYSCDEAEKQGMLITAGYVWRPPTGGDIAPSPHAQTPAETPAPQAQTLQAQTLQAQTPQALAPQLPASAEAPAPPYASPDQIDIGGVKLGMSPDEVRAVLKSKKLLEYNESAETLVYSDSIKGAMQPIANGRFINVIATWTPPPSSPVGDTFEGDGESYEVMFTPVPGKERVMAIVHSVGYSPANAIHEIALENGLAKKYGGFAGSNGLPDSPTWRFQSGGSVQLGDPCDRRGIYGGLGRLNVANAARENLALKRTLDEFRFQIERCGNAIVTEDHFTSNGGARREDRLVTRFTVTAYSPSIGFEGAKTAAQLIHAAGDADKKVDAPRVKDQPAPNL